MIPAGYLFKRVALSPAWISNPAVIDIYSVSNHGSEDFADYVNYWKHNGWWLFNRSADMIEITEREGVDPAALTLFYYEVFEEQYDEDEKQWLVFEPEVSFATEVDTPNAGELKGYDVVCFSAGQIPECSPLSCNSLADEIPVNAHCLFDSLDEAREALAAGKFDNSEPGPFRIFAVYTIPR